MSVGVYSAEASGNLIISKINHAMSYVRMFLMAVARSPALRTTSSVIISGKIPSPTYPHTRQRLYVTHMREINLTHYGNLLESQP